MKKKNDNKVTRHIPAELLDDLSSRFVERRLEALKQLQRRTGSQYLEPVFSGLLKDKNELVRIEAASALGNVSSKSALRSLWVATKDKVALVRGYAFEAIGKLGNDQDALMIMKSLSRERSAFVLLNQYEALFVLGKKQFFGDLLAYLASPNYRIRCACANTIAQIKMNKTEARTAKQMLRRRLKSEASRAARSSMRTALRELNPS